MTHDDAPTAGVAGEAGGLSLAGLPPRSVAIQAGGESRRMGRSKATVPFLGRPLLERIVTRVAPIAAEIVITTNEPENLGFLDDHPARGRIRLVRDRYDRRGSVTGLATALSAATNDCVAIVACDMVFASPELFLAEYRAMLADEGVDVVVPHTQFGYEPFHAVYRRARCLDALVSAIDDGCGSIRQFMETIAVRDFAMEEVARTVPDGRCFINTNTPDELAHAEQIVRDLARSGRG